MNQENIDPVYDYIDKKFKEIKHEFKQLKVNNDEVLKNHSGMILDIQRTMAYLQIEINVQTYSEIITEQLSGSDELFTQLIADAVKAKSEVLQSNLPSKIVTAFENTWTNNLEKAGAKIIHF
ncbi:MAG: hypothetical protein ABR954_03135 [Dehalococcoidales bacterium]